MTYQRLLSYTRKAIDDYQMIQECAIGVVSLKAPEKLKALGDYFFDDPDQDGIVKVINEMHL